MGMLESLTGVWSSKKASKSDRSLAACFEAIFGLEEAMSTVLNSVMSEPLLEDEGEELEANISRGMGRTRGRSG